MNQMERKEERELIFGEIKVTENVSVKVSQSTSHSKLADFNVRSYHKNNSKCK